MSTRSFVSFSTFSIVLVLILLFVPSSAIATIPVANAGADQTVLHAALPAVVTLGGSGVDPDGGIITAYQWTTVDIPPGSAATLSDPTSAAPTFTADEPGTYRFCLRVTDSGGELSSTDWVNLPTNACTNVMATTEHLALVLPAKGQRNYWDFLNVWGTKLDELWGVFVAYAAAVASPAGAALVGTIAKANLGGATTVEDALTFLDAALSTAGPFLPLAGGSMEGNISWNLDNTHRIGSLSEAAQALYSYLVASPGQLTMQAATGADDTAGSPLYCLAGDGGSAVAVAGGAGADAFFGAGDGGASVHGHPAGPGGHSWITGGDGGTGSIAFEGGTGGNLYLRGGAGGASGGMGTGTRGYVYVGDLNTAGLYFGSDGIHSTFYGDILFDLDQTRSIGSSTQFARDIFTHSVTGPFSVTGLVITGGTAPSPPLSGSKVTIQAGAGANASGAANAGNGGLLLLYGGTGGDGNGANLADAGGNIVLAGGHGGAGTAVVSGGNGANSYIRGGLGGTDGGAGAGANGSVVIGDINTASISVGQAAVTTTTVAGTVNLANIWQLAGVAVNATAANLNTLVGGHSTSADTLHRHERPDLLAHKGTLTTDIASGAPVRFSYWALPDLTLTTIHCFGGCATSDGDATNCSFQFYDKDGSAIAAAILTIPDDECGDTSGLANMLRFDATLAKSTLGANRIGEVKMEQTAGTGTCDIGPVTCQVY